MRKISTSLVLAGITTFSLFSVMGTASSADAPEAAPAASYTVTGNMAFTSNYIFRGLTQSWNRPVVQAGLDYAHTSGFYLGTWGSGVSDKEYNNASMEWDFYAGFNGKINDDLSWGVGAIHVYYPGGAANNTVKTKYNTTELNAQINYKFLNVKYSHSLTDLFGLNSDNPFTQPVTGDTKGSGYLEANVSYEVMDKLFLGAHVGRQKVANNSIYSYTDYKVSINKELPKEFFGLNVGLAYTTTNANKDAWIGVAPNGQTKFLGDDAVVLSVAKTF